MTHYRPLAAKERSAQRVRELREQRIFVADFLERNRRHPDAVTVLAEIARETTES